MSQPPASSGSSGEGDPPPGGPPPGGGGPGGNPDRAWRETFDAFERAIGRPLEAFMESEEFADAAAQFLKANAGMQAEFEKGSQAWREAWHLPAREDVQDLGSKLDEVVRQLAVLSERLSAIERRLGEPATSQERPSA